MKFLKFLPHCLIIGLLAMSVQFIEQACGSNYFVGWILFQGWALYFLAGCDVKGGAKSIAGWICGILTAAAIIIVGVKFKSGGDLMITCGMPLSVFLFATMAILFEKIKGLDFIPAWFLAAGAVFALASSGKSLIYSMLTVLISGAAGLLYGFVTVTLRTAYSKMVDAPAEDASEAVDGEVAGSAS